MYEKCILHLVGRIVNPQQGIGQPREAEVDRQEKEGQIDLAVRNLALRNLATTGLSRRVPIVLSGDPFFHFWFLM